MRECIDFIVKFVVIGFVIVICGSIESIMDFLMNYHPFIFNALLLAGLLYLYKVYKELLQEI